MAQVTFAPLRRATLRDQSSQSPSLRFRPRLRRGSFVLTLIRGSLQMGHPWPSAAQSASMPIAPRISARTQPSPTSQSAVSALSRKKARQCRCLTGWPDNLCITMSALRGNASQDAPRPLSNVAQICAQAPVLRTSCALLTESTVCAICDAERHVRHAHAERWARSVLRLTCV